MVKVELSAAPIERNADPQWHRAIPFAMTQRHACPGGNADVASSLGDDLQCIRWIAGVCMRDTRSLTANQIADKQGDDIAQQASHSQLGQGAIDAIRRLAHFFEQQDHRLTRGQRGRERRSAEARQQLKIAAKQAPMDGAAIR